MDIKEAYKVMQKASGIEVGDTVKVLRQFKDYEMGSGAFWYAEKEDRIGKTFLVAKVEFNTIILDINGNCVFPFFALEIIEKHKAEKMITIDGKEWSESTIKKALQEHAK